MKYLIVDADGWIRAQRITDGPAQAMPADHSPATIDEAHQAGLAKGTARRDAEGRLCVPQDDRRAWRLLRGRGRSGDDAFRALSDLRLLRAQIPQDVPGDVPELPVQPTGILPGLPLTYPEAPGLELRPSTPADLDLVADAVVTSGLQPAVCPPPGPGEGPCGCQPPEAHPWLMMARAMDNHGGWANTLTFNGQPIQYETVLLQGEQLRFVFTTHFTRERPAWFWREVTKPIYEAAAGMGVTRLVSFTRADRPDWIQSLKDNYGAVERPNPGDSLTRRLEYPLDLGRFQGWPARKLVGFDQTTGTVRVWEATAADLPAIRQLIRDQVPPGRRALALRTAEEYWHLDRATVLLVAKDGVLRYARAIRPRRGAVGNIAHLSAVSDDPEQDVAIAATRAWGLQVGYSQLTTFLPTRLMQSANIQKQFARAQARVVRERPDFRDPMTEIVYDL